MPRAGQPPATAPQPLPFLQPKVQASFLQLKPSGQQSLRLFFCSGFSWVVSTWAIRDRGGGWERASHDLCRVTGGSLGLGLGRQTGRRPAPGLRRGPPFKGHQGRPLPRKLV